MPRTLEARNRNSEVRKTVVAQGWIPSLLHGAAVKSRRLLRAKNQNSRADSTLIRLSSPATKNISIYENPKSRDIGAVPHSKRGAYASSRTLSAGCDGRGWCRRTSGAGADGKVVWS